MVKKLILALSIAFSSSLLYATSTVGVASVSILDIHSWTYEGDRPANPNNDFPPPYDSNITTVSFTEVGQANGGQTETGTGVLVFDGDVLTFGSLLLPDFDINISSGGGTDISASGATINFSTPKTINTGLNNLAPSASNTNGGFLVDGGQAIVADFSTLNTVVTDCAGPPDPNGILPLSLTGACPALSYLNLDGVKYILEGSITPEGGDTLTLTLETDNTSILVVEIVTETTASSAPFNVPIPTIALGLLACLLTGALLTCMSLLSS